MSIIMSAGKGELDLICYAGTCKWFAYCAYSAERKEAIDNKVEHVPENELFPRISVHAKDGVTGLECHSFQDGKYMEECS